MNNRLSLALSLVRASPMAKLSDRSFLAVIAVCLLALYLFRVGSIDSDKLLDTWFYLLGGWAGLNQAKDAAIGATAVAPQKVTEPPAIEDKAN